MKWAQWDKTQSRELLVCSYVCASHCAQLLHTILHRTDLIVFSLTLQTITTSPMMSIWGKGGWTSYRNTAVWWIAYTGVRVDGSRQRQSAAGGKKGSHKLTKKHNSSDIKKSRSSPCHLTTALEDDRDPDSYQTISIQVSFEIKQ